MKMVVHIMGIWSFGILICMSCNVMYAGGSSASQAVVQDEEQQKIVVSTMNGDACYILAQGLEFGRGVPQNDKGALRYYKEAVEKGSLPAHLRLANILLYGIMGKRDIARAVELLKKASAGTSKYADAQALLGVCYLRGMGVEKSVDRALQLFKWAYGSSLAKQKLGFCYYYGLGVEVSKKEADSLFKVAFSKLDVETVKGSWIDPETRFALAYAYLNGAGVERNEKVGLEWLEQAAQAGNLFASYYLGFCHEFGFAVQCDKEKAKRYYRAAEVSEGKLPFVDEQEECRIGGRRVIRVYKISEALNYFIAVIAQNRTTIAPKKEQMPVEDSVSHCTAFDSSIMAEEETPAADFQTNLADAKAGDCQAMMRVAWAYEHNIGIPEEERNEAQKKANEWYMQAANQGVVEALYNMGVRFERGIGVPRNSLLAFNHYMQAAQQHFHPSLFAAGCCYFQGIGVQKNVAKALDCWRRASNNGNAQASRSLAEYYLSHKPDESFRYFLKAYEQGDHESGMRLGDGYKEGLWGMSNLDAALLWYNKAAKKGVRGASFQVQGLLVKVAPTFGLDFTGEDGGAAAAASEPITADQFLAWSSQLRDPGKLRRASSFSRVDDDIFSGPATPMRDLILAVDSEGLGVPLILPGEKDEETAPKPRTCCCGKKKTSSPAYRKIASRKKKQRGCCGACCCVVL